MTNTNQENRTAQADFNLSENTGEMKGGMRNMTNQNDRKTRIVEPLIHRYRSLQYMGEHIRQTLDIGHTKYGLSSAEHYSMTNPKEAYLPNISYIVSLSQSGREEDRSEQVVLRVINNILENKATSDEENRLKCLDNRVVDEFFTDFYPGWCKELRSCIRERRFPPYAFIEKFRHLSKEETARLRKEQNTNAELTPAQWEMYKEKHLNPTNAKPNLMTRLRAYLSI
ncbi:MAG: hypothetical protein AABW79_00865 [Nanoarchaeota archaeon]